MGDTPRLRWQIVTVTRRNPSGGNHLWRAHDLPVALGESAAAPGGGVVWSAIRPFSDGLPTHANAWSDARDMLSRRLRHGQEAGQRGTAAHGESLPASYGFESPGATLHVDRSAARRQVVPGRPVCRETESVFRGGLRLELTPTPVGSDRRGGNEELADVPAAEAALPGEEPARSVGHFLTTLTVAEPTMVLSVVSVRVRVCEPSVLNVKLNTCTPASLPLKV